MCHHSPRLGCHSPRLVALGSAWLMTAIAMSRQEIDRVHVLRDLSAGRIAAAKSVARLHGRREPVSGRRQLAAIGGGQLRRSPPDGVSVRGRTRRAGRPERLAHDERPLRGKPWWCSCEFEGKNAVGEWF